MEIIHHLICANQNIASFVRIDMNRVRKHDTENLIKIRKSVICTDFLIDFLTLKIHKFIYCFYYGKIGDSNS